MIPTRALICLMCCVTLSCAQVSPSSEVSKAAPTSAAHQARHHIREALKADEEMDYALALTHYKQAQRAWGSRHADHQPDASGIGGVKHEEIARRVRQLPLQRQLASSPVDWALHEFNFPQALPLDTSLADLPYDTRTALSTLLGSYLLLGRDQEAKSLYASIVRRLWNFSIEDTDDVMALRAFVFSKTWERAPRPMLTSRRHALSLRRSVLTVWSWRRSVSFDVEVILGSWLRTGHFKRAVGARELSSNQWKHVLERAQSTGDLAWMARAFKELGLYPPKSPGPVHVVNAATRAAHLVRHRPDHHIDRMWLIGYITQLIDQLVDVTTWSVRAKRLLGIIRGIRVMPGSSLLIQRGIARLPEPTHLTAQERVKWGVAFGRDEWAVRAYQDEEPTSPGDQAHAVGLGETRHIPALLAHPVDELTYALWYDAALSLLKRGQRVEAGALITRLKTAYLGPRRYGVPQREERWRELAWEFKFMRLAIHQGSGEARLKALDAFLNGIPSDVSLTRAMNTDSIQVALLLDDLFALSVKPAIKAAMLRRLHQHKWLRAAIAGQLIHRYSATAYRPRDVPSTHWEDIRALYHDVFLGTTSYVFAMRALTKQYLARGAHDASFELWMRAYFEQRSAAPLTSSESLQNRLTRCDLSTIRDLCLEQIVLELDEELAQHPPVHRSRSWVPFALSPDRMDTRLRAYWRTHPVGDHLVGAMILDAAERPFSNSGMLPSGQALRAFPTAHSMKVLSRRGQCEEAAAIAHTEAVMVSAKSIYYGDARAIILNCMAFNHAAYALKILRAKSMAPHRAKVLLHLAYGLEWAGIHRRPAVKHQLRLVARALGQVPALHASE